MVAFTSNFRTMSHWVIATVFIHPLNEALAAFVMMQYSVLSTTAAQPTWLSDNDFGISLEMSSSLLPAIRNLIISRSKTMQEQQMRRTLARHLPNKPLHLLWTTFNSRLGIISNNMRAHCGVKQVLCSLQVRQFLCCLIGLYTWFCFSRSHDEIASELVNY